jgi:cobalt-zinc-cadmium efflux system outer membrane protein
VPAERAGEPWINTMRRRKSWIGTTAAACLALAGCASLDPEPDWRQVQALTEQTAHATPLWRRSPEATEAANAKVAELLEDGLKRDEAVQIALVNDPRLQAQFDQLGLGRADYVQAGLFTNPDLGAFIGFPIRLDGSAITLVTLLSDLWIVPAREAVAEVTLQVTIQQTASTVLQTLFEAEQAYDTVLYHEALLTLEREELELRRRSAERIQQSSAREREQAARESANTAGIGDQEIAFAREVRNLALARHHLAQILDLPARDRDVPLADRIDEPSEDAWSEDRAVAFALERRLDLAAARLEVEQARRRATLARRSRLAKVGAGPGYNGAFGTDDDWGPSVAITLPIFDWKQADLSSAAFQELQNEHQLEALEAQARREVADAMAERQLQRSQAEILRTEVLPALARLKEQTGPDGPHDLGVYLHWLQGQEQTIAAQRSYMDAVWGLRQAQSEFMRALYGGAARDR